MRPRLIRFLLPSMAAALCLLPHVSQACFWVKGTTLEGAIKVRGYENYPAGGAPLPTSANFMIPRARSSAKQLRIIIDLAPARAPGEMLPPPWRPTG